MVSLDWIGKHLSDGKDFKPLARRAMAEMIGEVYYVDLAAGSNSNSGESFDRALLTSAAAYDLVTADNNDYVMVTGWKTETGTGVIHRLDVAQTHFIGHTGLLNPYTPEKGSLYRSGAGDAPILRFEQEFVEVAGFSFNAVQGAGTESSSVSKGMVEIGDYLDANAAGDGNKAFLHNCHFPDWSSATTTTGVSLTGAHYATLRDIYIENIYGNIDAGIYCAGSDDSNPALATFENIVFRGGGGAATAVIEMDAAASNLQNSTINGLYGTRVTNMISLGTAYAAYCSIDNAVGDMAENSFFAGGSACDARDDLWTNYKWSAGGNVWGRDAILAAS